MDKLPIDQYLKEAFKRNRTAHTYKDVHIRAEELIKRCWVENVFIVFTDGLRTNEEQAVLYGKGRSSYIYNGKQYASPKEKIVTNSKPGQSMHNYGLALDFVTCDGFGKNIDYIVGPKWRRAAEIAKELGFIWGGDWKSFVDTPHIEYSNGYTARQINEGKWPTFKPFIPIKITNSDTIKGETEVVEETYEKNAEPSIWAKEAVEWAKKNNISDGTFLKKPATREEVITMLYRMSQLK